VPAGSTGDFVTVRDRAAVGATLAGVPMLKKRVSVMLKANSCGVQHGSKRSSPTLQIQAGARSHARRVRGPS
jgi:hypothetical protein